MIYQKGLAMDSEFEYARSVCRDIGEDMAERGYDIGGSGLVRHLKKYTWFSEAVDILGLGPAQDAVRLAYNEHLGLWIGDSE